MSDTAPVDIGHGLTAALRLSENFPDLEDGIPVGVLLTHACAKRGGETVQDFIPVKYPGLSPGMQAKNWDLVSRDPITLMPSVQYMCCGLHGFVTSGNWVPS